MFFIGFFPHFRFTFYLCSSLHQTQSGIQGFFFIYKDRKYTIILKNSNILYYNQDAPIL